MGRRSKSDELGLDQRIVDMHDTEKMTHSEISDQLKDEGLDLSREAVRRSYQNSMRQAGKYRIAAESCRQIMAMDDLTLEDPKALIKAITSTGSTQVKIAQFRLNFDKGAAKAKTVIYDDLAEKLSDKPEVLAVIADVISKAKVTENG